MDTFKTVLEMWFPCCEERTPYFSHVVLKCGKCTATTELDIKRLKTPEGDNVYECTDGLDYNMLYGKEVKVVCKECCNVSHFTMCENELSNDSIHYTRIEEQKR